MNNLPQPHTNWRTPRVRITETTPVVLRLQDGGCHRGKLETISLTGGLICLPQVLSQGSRISLVFLTRLGPVLGTAEMLRPVSTVQQPFRFVAIGRDDQSRLRTMVQPLQGPVDEVWIAKYRAAMDHHHSARGGILRLILGSLSLVTLLLTAAYILRVHLMR